MPARLARTPRTAALLGTGALAAGLLALAGPASAAPAGDAVPVPADGTFTVRGHGFGHGHGMSQYGAYGAARQGLTHRQILAFYYPGTTAGTVTGTIRVRITADTTRDVVVGVAPGLKVLDLGSRKTYALPRLAGATRWRLNVAGTRAVVGYYTPSSGTWHRYHPGGLSSLAGDGELSAAAPLTLWTPSGSRTYRGTLRAVSPGPGSVDRDTVNVLSFDDYVRGVVASEMPASWSAEAVQAQAVAARTYATWSRDQFPSRGWQICDTSSCQVYRGVDGENPRANDAVTATARQILLARGAAAFTQFSASSGGWTTSGGRSYLSAHADPYDGVAGNPVHDWSVRVSATRIRNAYPGLGTLKGVLVTRRDGSGDWGGRVATLVLDGSQRDITVSGDAFRAALGLRSSWFRF